MGIVWDRQAFLLSNKLVDEFEEALDRRARALAEEDGRVEVGTDDVVAAVRWLGGTEWISETLDEFARAGTNGDSQDD